MNLNDAPIRRKLTAVMMLTSTVVLFLTAAAFITYELITARKTLVENSQTVAQITAAESSDAVYFTDEKNCELILSKLKKDPTVIVGALFGRDGRLLARFPAGEQSGAFPPPHGPRNYTIKDGALDLFVPVRQDDKVVGELYMKWDLSPAYKRLRWYALMVAVVLLTTLGIGWLISNWLQKTISVPILGLVETATTVSSTRNYLVRARKYGRDELGQFTESFNHMLEQIAQQDDALRKNEEKLRKALELAQNAAEQVRALNAELENRVQSRTAELAASNHELEAFAYSVSHDLRAPLRHIDAFAQILGEDFPGNAEAQNYIAHIRHGAQNMGQLVDDLLKLSRLGRDRPKAERLDLNAIVQEVRAELDLETKGRSIEWKVAPLPPVTGDPGLIRQVFANLISNAVKYSRPRAQAVIEIGSEEANGQTAIFVRDNGVGFNMKFVDKLFGVFQRLHHSTEFEGTGVGLATVQRIVRLHGGNVWVNAELDKGAVFHFTLAGLEPASAHEQRN